MSKITLSQYWDMLNAFDWFYSWSDDGRVTKAGWEQEQKLKAIGGQSSEFHQLFEAFASHKFSGTCFGRPDVAKPVRPTE